MPFLWLALFKESEEMRFIKENETATTRIISCKRYKCLLFIITEDVIQFFFFFNAFNNFGFPSLLDLCTSTWKMDLMINFRFSFLFDYVVERYIHMRMANMFHMPFVLFVFFYCFKYDCMSRVELLTTKICT